MQLPSFPTFHPQGQFAVVVSGQTITLHSVSADGSIPAQPLQRVDVFPLVTTVNLRSLAGGVWNPQGTIVAFSGVDDQIGGFPGGIVFLSFQDGRLANVPGSPLPAGFNPSIPVATSDGFFYVDQLGSGPSPPTVVAYRVSPSGAQIAGSLTLANSSRNGMQLLEGERTLAADDAIYSRLGDGTLVERSRLMRNTRNDRVSPHYILRNNDVRKLTDTSLVYSAQRDFVTSLYWVESTASIGTATSLSGDIEMNRNERVWAVAQGGRFILTKTLEGVVRSWPVDASGRVGPVRSTASTSILGDPRVVVNPAGTAAYFFFREARGIVGVRVAADGQLLRFDPLPVGTGFQPADGANRLVFNVR